MGRTVLPSGEEVSVTPKELLRYAGPDAIRQLLRQERLHWLLKTNRDSDYIDPATNHKYASELHNEGDHLRMEIRTFPDNGANQGYAGVNIDGGGFGIPHNFDKWPETLSADSRETKVNRVVIGSTAVLYDKSGTGLDDDGNITSNTNNRTAAIVFDPVDGRPYLLSNDETVYVNNEQRAMSTRIPGRAIARIADIPTRITQLQNDAASVADSDFHHTDNNFTHSNRFILDNIDDRTFVYPEIAKNSDGQYLQNKRIGLSGAEMYGEADGSKTQNTQEDPSGDRSNNDNSSYGRNVNTSGVYHSDGYLPGVFASVEELEKVDLLRQKQTPLTHSATPGGRRPMNYYGIDGVWSPSWYSEDSSPSYNRRALKPSNMEIDSLEEEPNPFSAITNGGFDRSQLYQWRYNRVDVVYPSEMITIRCIETGSGYSAGDNLRWNFGNDEFIYRINQVGANGQIQSGEYVVMPGVSYKDNPSTHGIGIDFVNTSSTGSGAKFVIESKADAVVTAGQIKNNLYAYVDITPSVRSNNSSTWSDIRLTDPQGGKISVRSTAAGPAYSGINSGRGGPSPSEYTSESTLYEHGGNATAGVHVHLFRYVIDTQAPMFVDVDGVRVYLGRWVDQGPLGIERPCDIKALYLSNPDCNNFNNYYKFNADLVMDALNRNPDAISTSNPNAVCIPYIHLDQCDPTPDLRFTERRVDPDTGELVDVDVTKHVMYVNAATGTMFVYNDSYKNDSGRSNEYREPGWIGAGAYSEPMDNEYIIGEIQQAFSNTREYWRH